MFQFIWDTLVGFVQAFLAGGFIILALKLYEWWGDRFYSARVGKYLSKKQTVTVEISLPAGADTSISEMEAFFNEASVISGNRAPSEIMNVGKWFFQLCIDIVSVGGDVKMYLSVEKGRMELAQALMRKHYPDVILRDCEWPYKDWPKEWWDEEGVFGWKSYRGNDIVPLKSQIHPIKSYKDFYSRDGRLMNDPMETLLSYMRGIPKDSVMVLQFHLRPWPAAETKKKWKKELDALREEFTNNTMVEKRGNSIVPITTEEEKILDNARTKISKTQYRSKVRWMVIHDKKSKSLDPSMAAKGISAYLQEFETSQQRLGALKEMNTDAKAQSGKYGALDGILTSKINEVFWTTRQKEYTMRRLYNAIVNRDGGFSGNDDSFLSCEDLAGLIHFPQRRLSQVEMAKQALAIQSQNKIDGTSTAGNVVIQQYQPAYYIQQDGTVAPIDSNTTLQNQNIDNPLTIESQSTKNKPPENLPV